MINKLKQIEKYYNKLSAIAMFLVVLDILTFELGIYFYPDLIHFEASKLYRVCYFNNLTLALEGLKISSIYGIIAFTYNVLRKLHFAYLYYIFIIIFFFAFGSICNIITIILYSRGLLNV